ncbi:MAG: ChrR family anti-sigma-E factor [Myxococcota bacterium]
MIRHHLPDDWLMSYAAGVETPAESLLVASHLTVCAECRRRLEEAEAVGGALVANAPETSVGADLLAATLARLDAPPDPPPEPVHDPAGVLPAPLARVVGSFDDLPWRRVFFGLDQILLDVPHRASGPPARLFRIAAGGFIPAHAHRGTEASLVLTGGFTDPEGHFGRGDVCVRGDGTVHAQEMDADEPCVVLVVADQPFVGRSPLAWLAQVLRGF